MENRQRSSRYWHKKRNDRDRAETTETVLDLCATYPASAIMRVLADVIDEKDAAEIYTTTGITKEEYKKMLAEFADLSKEISKEAGTTEQALFLTVIMQKALDNLENTEAATWNI